MSQLLSKLQVTDSKSWSGLTREAHFGVLGMNDPQWLSKTVRRLYDINYGDDTLVNFIEKLPSIVDLYPNGISSFSSNGSALPCIVNVLLSLTL